MDASAFWSKVARSDSCWTWSGHRDRQGYGELHHRGMYLRAHRVAWQLMNGPIPDGLHVLHHCDNPPCVNPAHLFLGTNADNVADKTAKGRGRGGRGEAHRNAKLTADQVREIRELAASGLTQREIAARYGVRHTAIGKILRGERWGHLSPP